MWKLSKADFKLFRIKKSVGFSPWMHVKWTGDERSVWMEGSTLYIALHTDIRSSILNKNTDLGFIIPITNTYTQTWIDQCNDQSIGFSIKIQFKSHKYTHRRLLLYKLCHPEQRIIYFQLQRMYALFLSFQQPSITELHFL